MNDGAAVMPADLAREITRQGEVRLEAITSLATAADARATTLCGIFGAAGIALAAAALAYLATERPAVRLVAGGAVAALLLLVASMQAGFAAASRGFWIAGATPPELRKWSWADHAWRSEAELLDATGMRLAKAIERDRELLDLEGLRVNRALWIALAAVLAGMLIAALPLV